MEVTTSFEALRDGPPWAVQRPCGLQRAVNAEQASKHVMRKPTRLAIGEGCHRSGSERREHRPVPPGYWRQHAWKRGTDATREALPVAWHAPTDSSRGSGRAGQGGGEARSTGEAG